MSFAESVVELLSHRSLLMFCQQVPEWTNSLGSETHLRTPHNILYIEYKESLAVAIAVNRIKYGFNCTQFDIGV